MFTACNIHCIHCEIAEQNRGVGAGGIGAFHLMARKIGPIDRHLHLPKVHLPYRESGRAPSVAYDLPAGGTCPEHLELLRDGETHLDALGAWSEAWKKAEAFARDFIGS